MPTIRPTLLLLALLALPPLAHAELGGLPTATDSGQARVLAAQHSPPTPTLDYNTHTFSTDAGVHVIEYLNPDGVVFAVTWSGPVKPDLQLLLGSYFGRYINAVAEKHAGRRPFRLSDTDLIVESGGHMRAFNGRAYLPALLPAGFNPEILR